MSNRVKLSDLNYVAVIQYPILLAAEQWVMSRPAFQSLANNVPDWLLPFSFGVAVATLAYDILFRRESRVREAWRLLTDKFKVEHLHAGHWSQWRGEPMPETDIAVRLRIRFVRNVPNARLWLRVFSCTGQGREPFQHVIPIGRLNAIKGQILDIPVVDLGIPEPGWDATRSRGWGPGAEPALIPTSRNVVVLECSGRWLTQRHKFYISLVGHTGHHGSPRIHVQDEEEEIFDVSAHARTGLWRYGQ